MQRIFKSVCAFAQFDQSLSFPPGKTLDFWLPLKTEPSARNAQADLSLGLAHMPTCTFCWTPVHTVDSIASMVIARKYLPTCTLYKHVNFGNVGCRSEDPHSLLNYIMDTVLLCTCMYNI